MKEQLFGVAGSMVPSMDSWIILGSRLIIAVIFLGLAWVAPHPFIAKICDTIGHVAMFIALYGLVGESERNFQNHVVSFVNKRRSKWIQQN